MAVRSHYAPDVLAILDDHEHTWWIVDQPKLDPGQLRTEIDRLEALLRDLPNVPENVDRLICAKINLGAELMRRGPHEAPDGLEDARSLWGSVHVDASRLPDMPLLVDMRDQHLFEARFQVLTLIASFNSNVAMARLNIRGVAREFRRIAEARAAIIPNDKCDVMYEELGDALDAVM